MINPDGVTVLFELASTTPSPSPGGWRRDLEVEKEEWARLASNQRPTDYESSERQSANSGGLSRGWQVCEPCEQCHPNCCRR
jgi:hypothetical protein